MEGNKTKRADCYSDGDRKIMEFSQEIRARLLGPLLELLVKWKVNANHLTFLSLVMGLGACVAVYYSKPMFLFLLLLHVLIDGLDGPLARKIGMASPKGSFTDTMADQIVIAASTIVLIHLNVISPIPGGAYLFVYTMVIAFSMVRNAMNIPYSWLVRPRFVVYLWFIVEFYVWPGTIDYLLWGSVGLLTLKMLSGFYLIRKKM